MDYNIHHRPLTRVEKVEKHYQEKDGVPIKYVCTSSTKLGVTYGDIFYRETPHPEFGNRYFMLYDNDDGDRHFLIRDADFVEDLFFYMVEYEGKLHYSRGRHDYLKLGDGFIDGGMSYFRGNLKPRVFKVVNGEFEEVI